VNASSHAARQKVQIHSQMPSLHRTRRQEDHHTDALSPSGPRPAEGSYLLEGVASTSVDSTRERSISSQWSGS